MAESASGISSSPAAPAVIREDIRSRVNSHILEERAEGGPPTLHLEAHIAVARKG